MTKKHKGGSASSWTFSGTSGTGLPYPRKKISFPYGSVSTSDSSVLHYPGLAAWVVQYYLPCEGLTASYREARPLLRSVRLQGPRKARARRSRADFALSVLLLRTQLA
jgi:hypothetical protein